MIASRTRIGLSIAGAALLAVVAVMALFWRPAGVPHSPPTPVPVTPNGPAPGSGGVRPPSEGALLGAWVQPDKFTDAGRLAAKDQFEASVGRKLDIVHDFHQWADEFPTAFDREIVRGGAIPLISWGGTDTRMIAIGDEDAVIRERARAVKSFGKPLLLRWRWEMERPNLRGEVHGPADFIAAWKRVRAMFARERVTNASFVWCPLAEGFAAGKAQAYYPGDDQVDWVCADAYTLTPGREPLGQLLDPFLDWAEKRHKPAIVGEFGTVPGGKGERARWLAEAGALVAQRPAIKALVYFDADTEQRGEARRWSLRWDRADVAAFAGLARDPLLNRYKRAVSTR
jgi:hypothetical protein